MKHRVKSSIGLVLWIKWLKLTDSICLCVCMRLCVRTCLKTWTNLLEVLVEYCYRMFWFSLYFRHMKTIFFLCLKDVIPTCLSILRQGYIWARGMSTCKNNTVFFFGSHCRTHTIWQETSVGKRLSIPCTIMCSYRTTGFIRKYHRQCNSCAVSGFGRSQIHMLDVFKLILMFITIWVRWVKRFPFKGTTADTYLIQCNSQPVLHIIAVLPNLWCPNSQFFRKWNKLCTF